MTCVLAISSQLTSLFALLRCFFALLYSQDVFVRIIERQLSFLYDLIGNDPAAEDRDEIHFARLFVVIFFRWETYPFFFYKVQPNHSFADDLLDSSERQPCHSLVILVKVLELEH